MKKVARTKDDYKFSTTHWILCLILPASVLQIIIAGKNTDVTVYVPIVT